MLGFGKERERWRATQAEEQRKQEKLEKGTAHVSECRSPLEQTGRRWQQRGIKCVQENGFQKSGAVLACRGVWKGNDVHMEDP